MRIDVMRSSAMTAAGGRALRLGADRLKKFPDTTGRWLDLNSSRVAPFDCSLRDRISSVSAQWSPVVLL
jgi:hypothetical protein